jgi:histone H1/5
MDSFLEVMKNTVEALGAKYEFDAEEAMAEIDMAPFEELLKAKKPAGRPKKASGGGGSSDSTEVDPEKEAKRLDKNAAAKAKREAAKAAKVNDPTMAPKKAPSKKKISSESLDAAKESGKAAAAAIGASSASASEKPKRVLSEEQKEKMRLGRERKKAEKEAAAAAGTV